MNQKAMVMMGNPQGSPIEAHLWVCSGENIGRRFALDKSEHLIGRTTTADIPVLDERVSQNHAKVVLQDGHHLVEDLGSTNG
ncbi:MAG: FHA domain-containing protein, partial [Myxococcota bacterium]